MVNDDNVTLGEVYRLVLSLQKDIRDHSSKYITVELWAAEKRALDGERQATNRELRDVKVDQERLEGRIEADKKTRVQQWFAIGLAGLAAVLSTAGSIAVTLATRGG